MNWFKTLLSPIKHAIADWLRNRALELSKLDGEEGLSLDDFEIVLNWILMRVNAPMSKAMKHAEVVKLISERMGNKVPVWVIDRLVGYAYDYAKLKGVLP